MYSTDFNEFAVNMLPPNHRQATHKAWVKALLSPMVWANTNFFEDFVNGSSYAVYNIGTTYSYQDRVIYDHAVYESVQNSNTGHHITNPSWWIKVQDNYIGVYERIKYNSTKLIFEYALNKWFGGTFRQPPSTSDIYITNNVLSAQTFVIGYSGANSSSVGKTSSTGFVPEETVAYAQPTDFTINIPTGLYPAGGAEEIRQFADMINTVGLTYSIVQY